MFLFRFNSSSSLFTFTKCRKYVFHACVNMNAFAEYCIVRILCWFECIAVARSAAEKRI